MIYYTSSIWKYATFPLVKINFFATICFPVDMFLGVTAASKMTNPLNNLNMVYTRSSCKISEYLELRFLPQMTISAIQSAVWQWIEAHSVICYLINYPKYTQNMPILLNKSRSDLPHLVMQFEFCVHFNGLPWAHAILIDPFQQVAVIRHLPSTVPVNLLHITGQLVSVANTMKPVTKAL